MNGARRYFSDVGQERVYRTTAPAPEGVYSQTIYPDPAPVVQQVSEVRGGGGPWWANLPVDPGVPGVQRTQVYQQQYANNVRMVETQQLSPADLQLYERYLDRPPYDVVVEGDRNRKSNGKPRKSDYSGYWRGIGEPYAYSEQQTMAAPVQRRPVLVDDVGYQPYGYREVVTEAAPRPWVPAAGAVERRIVSNRVY